ncbi:MAG: hypothetical protein RL189_1359 [Pseudomonadota bacterium]|jgi:phosphoenolpyruvate-protein phosphotransferase
MKAISRKILRGLEISSGLVVGRISRHQSVAHASCHLGAALLPDEEWSRFITAQTQALEQISLLLEEATTSGNSTELPAVLEGYEFLITDSVLLERIRELIFEQQFDARAAVQKSFAEVKSMINARAEGYLKDKSLDLNACENFLINSFEQNQPEEDSHLKGRIIIVGHPSPQDVIRFHQAGVAAIISEYGSPLSHAAILARSFNIPALFSVQGILDCTRNGQTAILDTSEKQIIVNPSRSEIRKAEARRAVDLLIHQKLRSKATSIARTKDGHRVFVNANADGAVDTRALLASGAEGVGLLRTEFLHLSSEKMPTEQENTLFFKATSHALAPRWVTIRLLDAGGDKPFPAGHNYTAGPYGMRGIRFLLAEKNILQTQLAAIIKANTQGNLRVLIPFVTSVGEIRQVKLTAKSIWNELDAEERTALHFPLIGAMIETPAAMMQLDHIRSECDFVSIGSNDLTQHILCVERDSSVDSGQFSSFHPAVVRALALIFEQRTRAESGISLCGEIASDPVATELLVGLGCRHFSVRMSAVPLIKEIIRNIDGAEAEQLAQAVLLMSSADEICHILTSRYESRFDYSLGRAGTRNRAG